MQVKYEGNFNFVEKTKRFCIYILLKLIKSALTSFCGSGRFLSLIFYAVPGRTFKAIHQWHRYCFFTDIQKDLEVQLNEVNSLEDKIIHLRTYTKTLSKLTERYRMSFPYIFIYVLNKTKLVSTCKIFPGDIIYSDVSEERGLHCGKFNTLFFTDFKKKKGKEFLLNIRIVRWVNLH